MKGEIPQALLPRECCCYLSLGRRPASPRACLHALLCFPSTGHLQAGLHGPVSALPWDSVWVCLPCCLSCHRLPCSPVSYFIAPIPPDCVFPAWLFRKQAHCFPQLVLSKSKSLCPQRQGLCSSQMAKMTMEVKDSEKRWPG